MKLLDGKKVKEEVLENIKEELNELNKKLGLVVVQVGDDPASSVYVKQKEKMALSLGCNFNHIKLADDISEESLLSIIDELNNNEEVDGILVQLPIPKHLNVDKIINCINPNKDVDGLNNHNVYRLDNNIDGLVPCTALGVMEILKYYDIEINNKNVVVVGRSALVGKPVSKLLANEGGHVTVCHSKTGDISIYTKEADILVVAVGKKDLITKDMVKEGAVVVDVGINRVDGKLYGDVDFEHVSQKTSYITPVPGGVGPMTIAMLGKNLLKAYNLNNTKKKAKRLKK